MKYFTENLNDNNLKLASNIYIDIDSVFVWPSLDNEFISKNGSCYGLVNQLAILSDGTIVPCCLDAQGIISLGNIFTNKLDEVLNSDLAIKILNGFKNNKLEHELCQKCSFRVNKRN